MEGISDEEKKLREKREAMRKYQHFYYLQRKFIKDCDKVRKPEEPKTISIRKGEFLITFN
jgi:hypothetical protein